MSVDNKYKKHELRTHIYERPAMYIGTIEPTPIDTYIIDNSNKIIRKQISYIPGLFKILDEAARKIVELGAPYAPFPEDIRKEVDILSITRTWTFTKDETLSSQ